MTDPRTAPPYTEEEATQWLAWLAYNMRRRDMTIFQIESLQPDWLTGRRETTPHLLATRMLWGVMSGLAIGLVIGLVVSLVFRLIDGLIIGLVIGLILGVVSGMIGGLSELVIPLYKLDTSPQSQSKLTNNSIGTFTYGLVIGLVYLLIFGLIIGLTIGLIYGPTIGLIYGLIIGFIRTVRITQRTGNKQIYTVESLQWSWQQARRNVVKGLIAGPIGGLIGMLIGILIAGYDKGWIYGLIIGLIIGLIGGLIGGFRPGTPELKTRSNQGIWLTVRSAVKMGLPAGFITVAVLSSFLPIFASVTWLDVIGIGLLTGIVVALIVGLWYGGLDAIEHGIIRFIIARRGHAPLNYARFLDYAADELNFLQKVGGGYVFIHRYLLERFAEIAEEKGYVPVDGD